MKIRIAIVLVGLAALTAAGCKSTPEGEEVAYTVAVANRSGLTVNMVMVESDGMRTLVGRTIPDGRSVAGTWRITYLPATFALSWFSGGTPHRQVVDVAASLRHPHPGRLLIAIYSGDRLTLEQ